MSFNLKQFNFAKALSFVGLMMLGSEIGAYLSGLMGIVGVLGTAVSFALVFLIASYAMGFRITLQGMLFCVLFGFISVWIAAWMADVIALSSVFVSLITGFMLYFLLKQFTKTV